MLNTDIVLNQIMHTGQTKERVLTFQEYMWQTGNIWLIICFVLVTLGKFLCHEETSHVTWHVLHILNSLTQ